MAQRKDDALSTFSYTDKANRSDTFNLDQLRIAVNSHFRTTCDLRKVSRIGYRDKTYKVIDNDDKTLGIVRVLPPGFPRDRLESEVATLKYVAENTNIPVPEVYAWNSDASNPVGAEYIIMQKIPGVSADKVWDTLPISIRERVISDIATYLKAMFALRFDRTGSLYLSSQSGNEVYIGPIVSLPFYSADDGKACLPDAPQLTNQLLKYRGPLSNTTDYLQSRLHASFHIITHHRAFALSELNESDAEKANAQLEAGEKIMRKALELCTIYPGNDIPGGQVTTQTRPFSLLLDDFRLGSVMIDDKTGMVTGLLDFQETQISPLWECARNPAWLHDVNDAEGDYEGGPEEDRRRLLDVFLSTMDDEEWHALNKHGKSYRYFARCLMLGAGSWAFLGDKFIDKRVAWAKLHPGVGFPEEDD